MDSISAGAIAKSPARRLGRRSVALSLVFASGAAGLVWQMVWTTQFGVALGHEFIAVLSVMAAFFGGLAAGAGLLAGPIERSRYPGRWYAALEALIGIWALLVCWAAPAILALLARWIGATPSTSRHWSVAFFLPFLLLLPATMAMGSTLPAMERVLRHGGAGGSQLGALYAVNTAGAMVGLLLAVFLLIPAIGVREASLLFALVNIGCACLAWSAWGRVAIDAVPPAQQPQPAQSGTTLALRWPAAVAARLLLTGLLGAGYEVLAVRVLAQVTENTVYTYAMLLANFLLGTALGAAWLQRTSAAGAADGQRIDRALAWLVAALLAGGACLWWADRLLALPAQWFGPGLGAALAGEWIAGAAAMLLPSIAMGALFPLLCRQAQQAGMPLGQAFGLNTLGCALAPLAIGLFLLPQAGARTGLLLLLCGYLALRTRRGWMRPAGWAAAAGVLVLALATGPLRFIDLPEGSTLLSYREGVMAAVSVVEDAEGVARLHINNRVQEGSSASGLVETRLAQLPLLLHGDAKQALFLGYGTGYTARAAALDPQVQVTAVELLPEVVEASALFAARADLPPAARPVVTVAADARRFVQSTPQRYDVIVSDLFHPARNGAGSLYTVEQFAATRARLQPGGLFCQWLALHQMDLATLRSIVAAFLEVYPDGVAVLASNSLDTPVVGLIARPDAPRWRIDAVQARLAARSPAAAGAMKRASIDDAYAVLGSVIAGPAALRRFAGDAVVNTDDRPVVAHRAPWITYASNEAPRERLAALMHAVAPHLPEVLSDAVGADAARLQAYWTARADYLAVGMTVRPDADPRVMLQRLRTPLLRIAAASPDFHPASQPLIALLRAVRTSDPALSAEVDAALAQALSTPVSTSASASDSPSAAPSVAPSAAPSVSTSTSTIPH